MLHLDDFTDGVGELDHLRVGIPPGKHEVYLGRLPLDNLQNLVQVDEFQVNPISAIRVGPGQVIGLYKYISQKKAFYDLKSTFLGAKSSS